jgi:hypothetical protein
MTSLSVRGYGRPRPKSHGGDNLTIIIQNGETAGSPSTLPNSLGTRGPSTERSLRYPEYPVP